MKILISGANGLIGSAISKALPEEGHEISILGRKDLMESPLRLAEIMKGADVVIHLAGAPVARRWNKAWKKEIYDSRVLTTQNLAEAITRMSLPPKAFISTSASGAYPDEGTYDEYSPDYAPTFLGRVCRDWEDAAMKASPHCRVMIFRYGVVLSNQGGALSRLLPFFRMGIGGPAGNGRQPFPWIHINDVVRAFLYLLSRPEAKGVFNMVAPEIVSNSQFSKQLGKCLSRPSFLPVPAFILRIMFGEGAEILTRGQKLIPLRLKESGFVHEFPMLHPALCNLLKTGSGGASR